MKMCDDGSEEERKKKKTKLKSSQCDFALNFFFSLFLKNCLIEWLFICRYFMLDFNLFSFFLVHLFIIFYFIQITSIPIHLNAFFVDIRFLSCKYMYAHKNIFIFIISTSPINDFKVAIIYTLGTLYNSLSSRMI